MRRRPYGFAIGKIVWEGINGKKETGRKRRLMKEGNRPNPANDYPQNGKRRFQRNGRVKGGEKRRKENVAGHSFIQ